MIEVRVDFNSRGRGGMVRASQRRADGFLIQGDKVLAVDNDEGMSYIAIVDTVDNETGRVWLDVQWSASRPSFVTKSSEPAGWIRYGTQLTEVQQSNRSFESSPPSRVKVES